MGGRVDEATVGQSFEESLTGEANYRALLAVGVDGEEVDDSVGNFGGGGGGVSPLFREKLGLTYSLTF